MRIDSFLLFFVLIILLAMLVACSQEGGSQSGKGEGSGRNPDFVPFEYMSEDTKRDIKATVDAMLKWERPTVPSEDQLLATAEHIAGMYDTKNKFVRIYLPGMDTGSSAYALYSKRGDEPADLSVIGGNLPRRYKSKEPEDKKPSHFDNIKDMAEKFTTYQIDVLRGGDHPHIRIGVSQVESNLEYSPDLVFEDVDRALVYGVYRTFIHTGAAAVEVTAVPFVGHGRDKRFADNFEKSVDVTRGKALKTLNRTLGVDSFEELVGTWQGDTYYRNSPAPGFGEIKYEKRGQVLSRLM